ncbi:MFS transporter [Sulfurimonas lithotrophica]|uniref:MFS transporter n=2 Tax=Sulfurimonas lithotrophica TaxID=2590022 RepID=A0A5P8P3W8_9BACT|nr:MFS transporter [Sulfurimonas lithotrophica]
MFALTGVLNYLIVVFLNAFTDLGHKIIIQNTIFKVYDSSEQIILTAIINAMILLPFILVFSPSGFLADRFAKHTIMKHSAAFAVVITLFITFSYYQGWFLFAFLMTFLLALQSAIYSPAKYGYIKELVGEKFITQGNGAVQAVTIVAILGGIIFYSAFFESMVADNFHTNEDILKEIAPLGWFLVFGSIIEWFLASKLPNKMLKLSYKKFDFKKYIKGDYLLKNLKITKRKPEIFEAILALSILWSISQVILAIFGEYAKSQLGVTNALVVQGVMALAGFGIVLGSVVVSIYSKYFINLGYIVLGAFGITIVVFIVPYTASMAINAFLFLLFGVFTAFIIVPLNAQIQYLAPSVHLGTILAGNNFIQNIFMFTFLSITTIFAYFGMDSEVLFYIMGFVGIYLIYLVYKRYSYMAVWAIFTFLFCIRYKVEYKGLENIPKNQAVLLLGNHVSWLDWLILQMPIKKRINFMMDKDIYNYKILTPVLKKGNVIPISSKSFKDSMIEASNRLKNSEIVALYPEGEISIDNNLSKFKSGYEKLDGGDDCLIVPYFIDGMFGSLFAKNKNNQHDSMLKRRVISVEFEKPILNNIKADELQKIIQKLKDKKD